MPPIAAPTKPNKTTIAAINNVVLNQFPSI
jgi:hypothetical protein